MPAGTAIWLLTANAEAHAVAFAPAELLALGTAPKSAMFAIRSVRTDSDAELEPDSDPDPDPDRGDSGPQSTA